MWLEPGTATLVILEYQNWGRGEIEGEQLSRATFSPQDKGLPGGSCREGDRRDFCAEQQLLSPLLVRTVQGGGG